MSSRQVVGVAVAAATLLLASPASAELGSRCGKQPAGVTGGDETGSVIVPETIQIAFGSQRIQTDRDVKLNASPKLPENPMGSAEVDADLTKPGGEDSFPSEGIFVKPKVTPSGNLLLHICADPERPEHVDIGRYRGSIDISGPSVRTTSVPIEITLKAPLRTAVAWSVVGILVGLLLKGFADLRRSLDSAPTWSQLLNYFKQPWILVSALIGALGALAAIYSIYDATATWGTTADGAKLLFGAVTIQVTGMTAIDVVSGKSTPQV